MAEVQFARTNASPSTSRVTAFVDGVKVAVAHTMSASAERWPGNEDWPKDISSYWVHPDHAGSGVGEALLQHIGRPLRAGVTENNTLPPDPTPAARFKRPKHG